MADGGRRYELDGSEDVAAGVERLALGRIDHALDGLRGARSGTFPESVHEARKDLKKLRSLLRLVRGAIPYHVYRRENDRFRDVGRVLSGARDAEVKLETMDALRERGDRMPAGPSLRAFRGSLEEERDAHNSPGPERDAMTERAVAELEAGRAAVPDWRPAGDGWGIVAEEFRRGYRRGRNRFRETRDEPSPEHVHEWRKRVKDLWYHLRILSGSWPSVIGRMADEAHALSDLLGDHHDLTVLAADARGRADLFDGETTLGAVLSATERRQEELLPPALALGERIYAERPKAFLSRHAAYWSAWRAG